MTTCDVHASYKIDKILIKHDKLLHLHLSMERNPVLTSTFQSDPVDLLLDLIFNESIK